MNKILLIIRREYMTRVKKKSFIVMTFLVPFLFMAMYAVIFYVILNKEEFAEVEKIAVIDDSGSFRSLKSSTSIQYNYPAGTVEEARAHFKKSDNNYLLIIPSDKRNILLLSQKKPGISTVASIERQLSRINRTEKLLAAGIDTAIVNSKSNDLSITARQLTEEGEKDAGAWVAFGVAMLFSIMIYMSLLIYGVQVMRGVIEEKTNRIIEVVISSVKPFQLMLGKIIGVGMVGLTQFLLWIALSAISVTAAGLILLKDTDVSKIKTEQIKNTAGVQAAPAAGSTVGTDFLESLNTIPWTYTISVFIFYFLFGFLLYSSIFAAVGSAVDSETDTQQFMLPIIMPLIFTSIISINVVISNPGSPLAFWLSIIPFTSPIAMMVRIPFDVPAWQLALSMSLMIGGFLVITWIAARIYRVGILMYGKKATYKELVKWFFYKE
ncbi:ABC transporter permease [Hufsiella ginkgonis]|uniref:ABC transporter permease n=1 Tax=Hufsiella ginkgonis TaxID=2695274 RepID=A0A7K1XYW9_9SPHI|nr:ABC transporter permease [Hufsiella ginkgonis]MXV16191.1 ABC transporter permease [Hufsiella ginkgonis]